jgi:chromate transport protein ChrA
MLTGGNMLGILAAILYFAVPTALVMTTLYWIIRLGVKHGLRSYEAEKARDSEAAF